MSNAVNNILNDDPSVITDDGIKRDQYGRYILIDPTTGKEKHFTRATTLANCLDDTSSLEIWKLRNLAYGLGRRGDLFALASSVSSMSSGEDKATLDSVIRAANETACAPAKSNLGTALHGFTQRLDLGNDTEVPDQWVNDVQAYLSGMGEFGLWPYERFIEKVLIIPELETAGTVDRLLMGDCWELPRVGDLKTGKVDGKGRSFAIQLAIYAHATHWYEPKDDSYHEMPEVDKSVGVIIHLPIGEGRCDFYVVDLKAGWEAALLAYDILKWRKRNDLCFPLGKWEEPKADEPQGDDADTTGKQKRKSTKKSESAKKQNSKSTTKASDGSSNPPEEPSESEPTHRQCPTCGKQISVAHYGEHSDTHLFDARYEWVKARVSFVAVEHKLGDQLAEIWSRTCVGIPTFKVGGPRSHEEIDRVAGACALVEMVNTLPFFDDADPANEKPSINKWIGEQNNHEQQQLITTSK